MGHVVTPEEWANQIVKNCAPYSNRQMRDFIALLQRQARNLEYKDFHDASDKMWKERNSATIRALENELRRREACAIELCGRIDVQSLMNTWANWRDRPELYWIIHGILVGKPSFDDGATDELIFLKEIIRTKERMHAEQ